jgi:hypothetical protein
MVDSENNVQAGIYFNNKKVGFMTCSNGWYIAEFYSRELHHLAICTCNYAAFTAQYIRLVSQGLSIGSYNSNRKFIVKPAAEFRT